MTQDIKKKKDFLYNNIHLLSRNTTFYTNFGLIDTFQNRIHLIFIHISFIFIKIKQDKNKIYKSFYQEVFDLVFNKIETNMREIGHGDTTINKNMRSLVKTFYNILFYQVFSLIYFFTLLIILSGTTISHDVSLVKTPFS